MKDAGRGGVTRRTALRVALGGLGGFASLGIACQTPSPTAVVPSPRPDGGAGPGASPATRPPAGRQWSQIMTGPGPGARRDHSLTYAPDRGLLYLFGGRGPDPLSDLWTLEAASGGWKQVKVTGAAPPARFGHAAFYDTVRRRLLITLGQAGPNFFNDLWAFDPDSGAWSDLGPQSGARPALRYGSATAHDPATDRLLVSHGFTHQGRFHDTWGFSPGSMQWAPVATSGAVPLKRCLTRACWHQRDGKMLLFGGQSNERPFMDDLWSLDLSSGRWTELTPASKPGPRHFYAAAQDARGKHWYLYGGNTTGGPVGDLWRYDLDAGVWAEVQTAGAGPSPRYGQDIAIAGRDLFLFGGHDGRQELGETWKLLLEA